MMRLVSISRAVVATCFFVWLACSSFALGDEKLWLAVTTERLAPALEQLAAHRRSEGLRAEVFVGQPDQALAKFPRPQYLVLVGDVPAPGEPPQAAWQINAKEYQLYRWIERQRREYLSDSMWGDLNNDGLPEVPVGRLPARTVDEVQAMVKKIMAYEQRPWSTDDLRLPVWVGNPMATPVFNRMATGLVLGQIRTHSPKWCEPSLIYGDISSPFCGWPRSQAATFNSWLKRGGMFATIGAHGSEYSWYSVSDNGRWVTYDIRQQRAALQQGPPTCPLFVFTCDSGNFAATGRSVTEATVLAPGGPVAAVGATTESHPLPNNLTIRGLQATVLSSPERFGDFWVQSLRKGYELKDVLMQSLLKDLEGSIEENIDVAKLRRDQLRMYALMGDPALKIRIPRQLDVNVERGEDGWKWNVSRPEGAVSLHVDFRAANIQLPLRKKDVDQANAEKLLEQANQLFAYEPLQKLTQEQTWEGTTTKRGELRFVAMAPTVWYAAVVKVGD